MNEQELIKAVKEGNIARVIELLQLGASPNTIERSEKIVDGVHWSGALAGDEYMSVPRTTFFQETIKSEVEESVLYIAIYNSHRDIADILLRKGAKPDVGRTETRTTYTSSTLSPVFDYMDYEISPAIVRENKHVDKITETPSELLRRLHLPAIEALARNAAPLGRGTHSVDRIL